MTKNHRSEKFIITVRNTPLGWAIINALKSQFPIRLRGRHPNRKFIMHHNGLTPKLCGDIPVRLSEFIAVYMR